MARYDIMTVWAGPPQRIDRTHRKRRDAAALAYERAIYDVLDVLSLRDKPIALRLLTKANQAYDNRCMEHDTEFPSGYKVCFWRS